MKEDNQLAIQTSEAIQMATNERQGLGGTLAKDVERNVLRSVVRHAVARAYATTNIAETRENISIVIDTFTNEIMRAWGSIRLEEIGLAIHRGSLGEFEKDGKVWKLSLAVFVYFIRSYMNSDQRTIALKNHISQTQLLLPTPKPDDEEINRTREKIIISSFEYFKEKGYFQDHGNYVFDTLAKLGLISFKQDELNLIWRQAKSNVFKSLTRPVNGIAERNEQRAKLKEVKDDVNHPKFFVEAKKIGINKFYQSLVDFETEISTLIENAKV